MRTKLSIEAQDDRRVIDRDDRLAQEDEAWVKMRDAEIRAFKIAVLKLTDFLLKHLNPTAEDAACFVELAENAAHEASKLQKTLEKGNKV